MATATAPQETASFHSWSDLSTELQLEVLGHALTFAGPIDHNTSYQAVSLLIPVLRCGNTELAAIARESCKRNGGSGQLGSAHLNQQLTEADYKSNKFVTTIPLFLMSLPRFPPLDAYKWIRRFEVTFNLYTSRRNDQNLDMDTAWRVLLASTQMTPGQDVTHDRAALQAIRRSTNWQTRFPNLKIFHLKVKIRRPCEVLLVTWKTIAAYFPVHS